MVSTTAIKRMVEGLGSQDDTYVRGQKLARSLKCRELRSKKNSYLVVHYDELGNRVVMLRNGTIRQLFDGEEA